MRRWLIPFLILGCLAGLFVACYGRVIFWREQFANRDAAHYYYPLHQRVQAEWDAGRWPLWEPEENSGMPLLGNPTAAVLYPGKLVFALFRYPLAARLYVMGHTLLAFAAMLSLLRHWGTSWVGSSLGALAYTFGGPVLFQYCNVIYLVGAAWLPLGFRAVDRWLRGGRRLALAELAVVLAMETLGGDPESAYLTGLCAAAYAAGLAWRGGRTGVAETDGEIRRGKVATVVLGVVGLLTLWVVATLAVAYSVSVFRPVPPAQQLQSSPPWTPWVGPVVATAWGLGALVLVARWRRLRRSRSRPVLVPMLFGLVVAAVVATASSAAQLLPILEFTGQSDRAAEGSPHEIYPFSLHPIRVVEFVWPNIFGTYPGNKLWLEALPLRGTNTPLWVPTLYLGGLTLVLALGGSRLRPGRESNPWRTWMAAVAVASLLAGFGEFGSPIWLARTVPGATTLIGPDGPTVPASALSHHYLRDGDGGVYWILATGLPGFGQFRYPSKLLTFTALALAALAAQGWDALASGDPHARRRMAAWSGILLVPTLIALGSCVAHRGEFVTWLQSRSITSVFGPFDAPAAVVETQNGLVQAALVLAVALVLSLWLAGRHPAPAAVLVLAVTSVDLALANARVVTTVGQPVMDSTPEVVSIIERAEKERPMPGPYRVHRVPIWSPTTWRDTVSPDRVRECIVWERLTAVPKYGINFGVHYTRTLGVAQLDDYEWFFGSFYYQARDQAARVFGVERGTRLNAHSRRAFDMWNSRYFILPFCPKWDDQHRGIASFIDRTERIYPRPDAFEGANGVDRATDWVKNHDYQVRRNLDAYPRSWVVHDARSLPAFHGLSRTGRNVLMQEMLFSNDLSWPDPTRTIYNPRRYVWLEDSDLPGLAAYLSGGTTSTREAARIVHYQPDRVELEAVLERPGIVVLADIYYPGWTLTIDGQPAPVYRANRMMRGAAVAAGRHTLVYRFRPASFHIGLVISGLGLAALGMLAVWGARK